MINMKLIQDIIALIESKYSYTKVRYFLITNGTLLTPKFVDYFREKNINLTVSVDGNKHIHDSNRKYRISRKGTYEVIENNLLQCFNRAPDYYINHIMLACSCEQHLERSQYMRWMKESKIYKGNRVTFREIRRYNEQQKNEMIPYVVSINEDIDISDDINAIKILRVLLEKRSNLFDLHPSDKIIIGGMCVPGVNKVFMDVDGIYRLCIRSTLSHEVSEARSPVSITKLRPIYTEYYTMLRDYCRNCFCSRVCHACFANFYNFSITSYESNERLCHFVHKNLEKAIGYYIQNSDNSNLIPNEGNKRC